MSSAKRIHPSPRVGELPDGTIVRAPAGQRGWFYAQKWNGAMIVYARVGHDELALDEIIRLPVAFVLLHHATSMFWERFWKPRPEVVGTISPDVTQIAPDVSLDLAQRELVTWDAATGCSTRRVGFDELDGVIVSPGLGLTGQDIVDRLECVIDGRPWPDELRIDHRTWTVDRHGQFVVRPEIESIPDSSARPTSLLELAPDNPTFVEELVMATPTDAIAFIEAALEGARSSDEYLERDEGGRAILAAAIVAMALKPKVANELEADPYMILVAKKIRKSVRPEVVGSAERAIRRVLGAESELGSEFVANSPSSGAFVASIASHLSKARLPF